MDAHEAAGALGSLGLTLPSPAYLLGAVLFGIYGWVTWRRGKKTGSSQLRWTGLALMLFPYVVSDTWLLWLLGLGLCAWVWWTWE